MDDCVANFPEDIVKEILLRCSVRSLLKFKCVCKNWYVLTKTPEFVQQHLKNRSSPRLLIYDNDDYDDDDDDSRSMTLISKENLQTFIGMTKLIGYVDGLFLMYGEIDSVTSYALWNPATREVRPLHLLAPIIDDFPEFGLGIDPLKNDYKVVYFLRHLSCDYASAVYSCCRDSWRNFKPKDFYKPPPFHKDVRCTSGTAYLNGAYYWLLSENNINTILLFDFEREMFEEMEGPYRHFIHSHALGMMLLDDSIAILLLNTQERFSYDIWVMIQPGVWNKIVNFQCFQQIRSCYGCSLILVTKTSRLVSYNVLTRRGILDFNICA